MWEILGIAPTTDLKEIKRAYAKLAKQYNPEEHPEEFKQIFDAYKTACAIAKAVKEKCSEYAASVEAAPAKEADITTEEVSVPKQPEETPQPEFDFSSVDIFPDFDISPEQAKEKFLRSMALILADKAKRDDVECWKWLLGKPTFLSVCDDKDFRKKAQKLLDKELLPPNAASYIAGRFSSGSRALPQKKSGKWSVYISHSGKKPPKSYDVPSYMGGPTMLQRSAPKLMGLVVIALIFFLMAFGGSLLQQYFYFSS